MRALSFLVIQCVGTIFGLSQSARLYVFLPSNIRPHVMRQALVGACPEMDITVFSRFLEFQARTKEIPPDALLSLRPVIDGKEEYDAYRPVLTGNLGGAREEAYAFLSVNRQIEPRNMDSLTIGAVDLLGRSEMNHFLGRLLGKQPKIRTVTKLEDLLTLLQFEDVTAIFVPHSKLAYYQERSRLDLKITELPNVVIGLPVLAVRSDKPEIQKLLRECFLSFSKDLNSNLGVDKWVQP